MEPPMNVGGSGVSAIVVGGRGQPSVTLITTISTIHSASPE